MWRYGLYILACCLSLAMALALMSQAVMLFYPQTLIFSQPNSETTGKPDEDEPAEVWNTAAQTGEMLQEGNMDEPIMDVLRYLLRKGEQ